MARHYFLTGATGVVGSAVLQRLAAREERVTLLLRAESPGRGRERLDNLIAYCDVSPQAAEHIDMVVGDLYAPGLGLADAEFERVSGSCTHLLHCAGNVHMNLPLEKARTQTLTMTKGMLELLAAATKAEKMEYVSTVGVAGHTPGEMPEGWITHRRAFRNSYEAAKAEAEDLVRAQIDDGRPITVHRPSMVVGDSRSGKNISFQVFYYLCEFLCGGRTRGFIPWVGDKRLDVIPSDYVAAVIDWSSQQKDLPTPILHLCSGPDGAVPLQRLIPEVRRVFTTNGRRLPAVKPVPATVLKAMLRLMRPLIPPRQRRAVDALPFFFAYLKERQTFGNQVTRELLAAAGIALPKAEDYLDTVLRYYLEAVERM